MPFRVLNAGLLLLAVNALPAAADTTRLGMKADDSLTIHWKTVSKGTYWAWTGDPVFQLRAQVCRLGGRCVDFEPALRLTVSKDSGNAEFHVVNQRLRLGGAALNAAAARLPWMRDSGIYLKVTFEGYRSVVGNDYISDRILPIQSLGPLQGNHSLDMLVGRYQSVAEVDVLWSPKTEAAPGTTVRYQGGAAIGYEPVIR